MPCIISRKLGAFPSASVVILFLGLVGFGPYVSIASAGNEQTIALVMKALTNPFFAKMESGAKVFAQKRNIPLEVFGVERETDVERQIGIVENLITRGYGAIVIAPADSKQLVPVCQKALQKGIIVINIDNPFQQKTLEKAGVSIPFVGPDNRTGAAKIGDYLKHLLKGRGRVIVIEGIPGVENAELRKKGFIEAITRESHINVVATESANWHTDEALSLAVRLLQDCAPVDAVFCANDKMALGVLQALDILGLAKKIWLAGYDNIEAVRYEMQAGRIHATAEQHPELMGRFGVELATWALQGKKIPGYVPIAVDLITYETFNKTIAFSISNLQNPFFVSLHQGMQEVAALHGVKLVVNDAHNDNAQQLMDLFTFINGEIDALIINPTNTVTVGPGIELANRKGIPVITVDRKAAEGQVICHIESDNLKGGRMAADVLARQLGGKGRVIELEGIPGTSASQDRGAGFNKALLDFPDIKVVAREVADFERQKARAVMQRILDKGLQFEGVFAHNDNMILGALDALEKQVAPVRRKLIGFDGIQEALEALKQGKLTGIVTQKPFEMGVLTLQSLARFFRGEEVKPQILVDLEVIEK